MVRRPKQFNVDTEPSKEVVVDSLTRDASVEACIFDLIDNSIDAARDTILARPDSIAMVGLPSSYDGFGLKLELSGDGLHLSDNCGGISVDALKSMVLRFGRQSGHKLGIGVFGVGLNRAIFKLGKVTHFKTDTGTQRSELVLRTAEYLKKDGWELPAEEFKSSGKVGTVIEIREPQSDISQNFGDRDWLERFRDAVGRRYARFIDKGFSIEVNGVGSIAEEIEIREAGPYDPEKKFFRANNNVSVTIEYGQHSKHRFTKEPGYDRKTNEKLTNEFGWSVFCNDRAVLIADRSDKTGWDTKFHTEFYGFVGSVSFISDDPSQLPWNTTKTDVDLNNEAYRLALADMKSFAEKWRAFSDQRKKPGAFPNPIPSQAAQAPSVSGPSTNSTPQPAPQTPTSGSGKSAKANGRQAPAVVPPTTKQDFHSFRTVLPDDVDERHIKDKHLAMVHEAKQLDLYVHTFTGLALIRMLFEISMLCFLHRQGDYEKVRKFAADRRRADGKSVSPAQEKNIVPTTEDILPYVEQNPGVWGTGESHLKHSFTSVKNHQPILNSAIHNPFQIFPKSKAFDIRNELLPILRYLIETA